MKYKTCISIGEKNPQKLKTILKKALSSGKGWGSEQIAMNITIYVDKHEVEILPAYCNYTLIDGMKFDTKRNTFVEAYLPNHKIGIVHLAGKNNNNVRMNKNHLVQFKTLEGKIIKKTPRFNQIEKK